MSRILRGLSSRLLPCGCLVGVYETYHGRVVEIVDARAAACAAAAHATGRSVGPAREPGEPAGDER